MIKTLRITIIVTAIVAVVFFVLSAVFGLRHDKDKEGFLANPGVTAVFKKNGQGKGAGEQLNAPLIKQAQAFALRIAPPPPKVVVDTRVAAVKPIITPQFKLLGTSIYPNDPSKSMALIDEPGKGMHWVVASDKIDYLTVVRIEDGKIVYADGKKTMEMVTEKPPEIPGIVVLPNTPSRAPIGVPIPAPAVGNAAPSQPETSAVAGSQEQAPGQTSEAEVKANLDFIKKVLAESNEAKEGGISKEEANGLQNLGNFLKQVEEEQKRAEANAVKAEVNQPKGN